jgi:MFS family permease
MDIGFSYWLAEYFITSVGSAKVLSSLTVGVYLCGIIMGRFSVSRIKKNVKIVSIIFIGLLISTTALFLLLNLPNPLVKLVLCFIYGIGVGPVFPMLMSKGTELYPRKSGAVTGLLFAFMSLGGMVFPLLIGYIGNTRGLGGAYGSLFFIGALIFMGVIIINNSEKKVAGTNPSV